MLSGSCWGGLSKEVTTEGNSSDEKEASWKDLEKGPQDLQASKCRLTGDELCE